MKLARRGNVATLRQTSTSARASRSPFADDCHNYARGFGGLMRINAPDMDEMQGLADENALLKEAVAQMKARIDELELLADTDTLTPLPNRRAFLRRLDGVIRQAARHNTPAAVLFIDLDGLKRINDDYGHHAGDKVLQHVAGLLGESLRATDMVARIGGDEFGLILDHLGQDDAVGAATVRPDDSVAGVIERADHAMYAKRLHRSQT
jgi:GGDEF domain-containing protein